MPRGWQVVTKAAPTTAQWSQEEIARVFTHLKSHWQRRYGLVEVG